MGTILPRPDPAKPINTKRHLLTDTGGLLSRVVVHPASVQDHNGTALVLEGLGRRCPGLELVRADTGCHAHQVDTTIAAIPGLRLGTVLPHDLELVGRQMLRHSASLCWTG